MNIFKEIIELFALYLLYKLIFDFIIPIAKTTKQVKRQFSDMHSQMQENMNQYNREQQPKASTTSTVKTSSTKADNEDYIEFEEIK